MAIGVIQATQLGSKVLEQYAAVAQMDPSQLVSDFAGRYGYDQIESLGELAQSVNLAMLSGKFIDIDNQHHGQMPSLAELNSALLAQGATRPQAITLIAEGVTDSAKTVASVAIPTVKILTVAAVVAGAAYLAWSLGLLRHARG